MVANKQIPTNIPMISFDNNRIFPTNIYPTTMENSTTIRNGQSTATMGKVVRIRPNIYVFVCEYDGCKIEYRSIDSFLRHTESHFQNNSSVDTPIHTTTHVHGNFQPSRMTQSESSHTNGHRVSFNGYARNHNTSNPEPISSFEPHPIDIITADSFPQNNDDDYVYEVYEIVDLGYDPDGKKFPKAKKLDSSIKRSKLPVKNNNISKTPESTDDFPCPFCFRKYKKEKALVRHKKKQHINILEKFSELKSFYKCLICNTKFPKAKRIEAEKHMKKHFRGQPKK